MENAKARRGLVLAAAMGAVAGCHRPHAIEHIPPHLDPLSGVPIRAPRPDDDLVQHASEDPLAFLRMCRENYLAKVRDYRCIFHIQERQAEGQLGAEQEIAILFRESPYSVDMRWIKNPVQATRVNYVAGRWRKGDRDLAFIQPSGLLALVTPAGVKLDIHAPEVRTASRQPVDDFGFRRTLEIIIENCEKAMAGGPHDKPLSLLGRGEGVRVEVAESGPPYDLRCLGESDLDGRPCIVLRRLLPYSGPRGAYPDRMLLIYIDREWFVPTGCFSYTDDDGRQPIGTYVTTDVEWNVGLTDDDF